VSQTTEVETFYGKHNKYTVIKKSGGTFGSPKYYVKISNGETKGSWDSLSDAVEWATQRADKR
jgi:hypothetical protein